MDADRDDKTQEEVKAREKEDRAREQQEQAGMRIISCELSYLISSQLFRIHGPRN